MTAGDRETAADTDAMSRYMGFIATVSLNDHPEIRRVFAGFHIESVPIQYTIGGGKGVERRELIIFSWDDAAQPAGLF
ncbi:N-6 adenine-specific DNA methylase 2 domain protein [Burkholderia pseudomallei MSHR4012]|nr:N-6 adenine-specific DNA methylase 2 domain protein [Burkholderia pseudomallei MSHR4012]KGV49772.1 N-6 adenine-specific DNA methylase 2 domain protein [Burkholderia pseudomallei MSHR4003]